MKSLKKRGAALTVALMMGVTVIAKVLGLIRSTLLASHYGTTEAANAFSAALRIPLSFFDLLFSAAIVACFIPIYNEFSDTESKEADGFASVFLNAMLLFASAATLLGVLFAPELIATVASGLNAETQALAATLLRILFPMVIFAAGTYTLVGVLQSKGSYLIPAAISTVSNLGVILYFLFLDRALGENGIYGLAVAYLISWGLQFVTLIVPLIRHRFAYRLRLDFKDGHLLRALKMVPLILVGSWLLPAASLVGTFFASKASLPSAVSVFDYANNIYIIVAGLLTYSITNFLFPRLSKLSGTCEDGFVRDLRIGLRSSLYLILPVLAAVLVLAEEGVCVLYLGGTFTPADAENVAVTLRAICVGMPAFALSELLSRAFYSRKELLPPALAALLGVAANGIVCGVVLATGTELPIVAVGLGNAAGQIVCALTLMLFSIRRMEGLYDRETGVAVLKTLFASAVAFAVMYGCHRLLGWQATTLSRPANLLSCLLVFVPGVLSYLLSARLIKLKFR